MTCSPLKTRACRYGRYSAPSPGVCWYCNNKAASLGDHLQTTIHITLDALESLIAGRSRYHIGAFKRIKSCKGCNGRREWINHHVKFPRFHRLRRAA